MRPGAARVVVALVGLVGLVGPGCATRRPVLYPNAQLQSAGWEAAQGDIDACIQRANDFGVGPGGGRRVARDTAEGAAVGGAAGAAGGAVLGRAGEGAGAGAAAAGTGSFLRSLFRSRDPDTLHKRFVERCLRDRGYDVLGWR